LLYADMHELLEGKLNDTAAVRRGDVLRGHKLMASAASACGQAVIDFGQLRYLPSHLRVDIRDWCHK
jgi:hypothetical protein